MSKDLEEQLKEMGSEYRAVVMRLRGAETAPLHGATLLRGGSVSLPHGRRWLVAASLLVLVGFGVVFLRRQDFRHETEDMSFAPREYRASVSEMIATQNADGSWKNDFLTRRNAAALKGCGDPAAQVADKKAMRNLRLRGVL